MTKKNKKDAIVFLGSNLENYNIKKVFTKSFSDFLKYLEENQDSLDAVIVQPEHLSVCKMAKILSMKKEIAVLETIKTDKILKSKDNVDDTNN